MTRAAQPAVIVDRDRQYTRPAAVHPGTAPLGGHP
jgi:hypothetical protein